MWHLASSRGYWTLAGCRLSYGFFVTLRKLAAERHALRDITAPLGNGLFELKTSHNGMEYRCIYIHYHPDIVVLVCFEKKKRKTPRHHIELARSRYAELLRKERSVAKIVLH